MEVRNVGNSFQTRIRWVDIVVLLIVVAAFALISGRLVSPQPFSYDESDYMYAASKGFLATYLDRPSIPLIDFLSTGIRSGLHSEERRSLSEYIRQKDDINLYRHFHGPLYFYCLEFIENPWGPRESIVRWISLLSLMLTAVIVYVGSLALAGKQGRFVGLVAVGFLLLSPTTIEAARWIAPHSLYSASAMATLFFLAKLVQTKNLRFLYGALVSLGLAFLTIEYAPLLLIALLVTVFVQRRKLFSEWPRNDLFRFSLKVVAIPFLVVGVLWPAGLYKLSLVKNYVFFLYYATMRNREYGTESLSHVWWTRVTSSPLEYSMLLSFSCFLLFLLFRRRELLYLLPFCVYALLVFLTTVRNHSESAYYVSSLIACLGVISAFAVSRMMEARPKLRAPIAALMLLGLAANNFWYYYRIEAKKPADQRLTAIVDMLQKSGVRGQRLLVPANYVPTIHYYFQGTHISGYTEGNSSEQISRRLINGNFYGLVYEGSDYKGLGTLLEKNWSIRSITRVESDKPGRAVAYYRLLAIRSALVRSGTTPKQRS